MKRFFDPSRVVLDPRSIVQAFTGNREEDLHLPATAIVVFDRGALGRLTAGRNSPPIAAWQSFRNIHHIEGTDTVITQSGFGGPNVAALVEELSAFGVRQFIMSGYCGGISREGKVGSLYIAERALREDGTSYHYLEDDDAEYVGSEWVGDWTEKALEAGIECVDIWSTDAIYRETENKIDACARRGISGVEMEVASFYAVAAARGVKAVAFLVVSDVFSRGMWTGGFHSKAFKEGVGRMTAFLKERAIR